MQESKIARYFVDKSIISKSMKDLLLDEVFIYLLERTERQTKRYANAALKSVGIEITPEQWAILKRVSENDSVNQREMASLTFRDPASITRALDSLEEKGWIRRVDTLNDRRAYHLELTEEGQNIVARITPVAQAVRAQGLTNIDAAELAQFKKTLNKIYQNYGG